MWLTMHRCLRRRNLSRHALGVQFELLFRTYVSWAHPRPIPEVAVRKAMEDILHDVQERQDRRRSKFERYRDRQGAEKASENPKEFRVTDETIELAINLNLDPRRPGQALRGSIALPHGSGKKINCAVFTGDTDLQQSAREAGALHAGGEGLVDQLVSGHVPVDSFQRSLATPDIMPVLTKKVARLLGPRSLMPNAKVGTLVQPGELLDALETQIAGKEVQYRTEKEGIVHVALGKSSFGLDKLLENIGEVMKTIFEVRPENFGKGKKKKGGAGKGTKYLLRASLSSTQGKGIRLDLRTVDPSSAFFLKSADSGKEDEEAAEEKPQTMDDETLQKLMQKKIEL